MNIPENIHPSHEGLVKYFEYKHLPERLQHTSSLFHFLVEDLLRKFYSDQSQGFHPDGVELTVALRKLLEAKDAAVRSFV